MTPQQMDIVLISFIFLFEFHSNFFAAKLPSILYQPQKAKRNNILVPSLFTYFPDHNWLIKFKNC